MSFLTSSTNNFLYFDPSEWATQSSKLILGVIAANLREHGKCRLMLTGGKSAEKLYTAWEESSAFCTATGIQFYFGDERCVAPDHPESNYGMSMRKLFPKGVPEGCSVFRMEADDPDREASALRYNNELQERIDVLLIGVGEDGHIASLFPGSPELKETDRRVVPVSGPKPPFNRLTITAPVIAEARTVFVLAPGEVKTQILMRALQEPGAVDALPVRLVLGATWLLDSPLSGTEI
ncbi:6-phosphogluconolactonase [uncultured Woeseiaceae bacterium]|uniref:6-phosphogluconolactonase n=1 Tax=uncultured Woeseiaceae bacterium TaxID=1983305 RepID=A0A7D9D3W5_9GAMM|nr:6-phosphogluconolactonase [uncultured Woeseiaceae bacterium]